MGKCSIEQKIKIGCNQGRKVDLLDQAVRFGQFRVHAKTLPEVGMQDGFAVDEGGGDPVRGCAALAFGQLRGARTGDAGRRPVLLGRPFHQFPQERVPGRQARLRA